MIKPLLLGGKSFPVNIIQGPLAGVSCAPFRLLTRQYSQPAFSCTEMISCKTLIHQPKLAYQRFVAKDPDEGAVCFQLAGSDPAELSQAVKIATDCGADLIDLNCGCPVKKIRSKGAGSGLLTDATKLYQLISAMKRSTHVPVSIKIRVEGGGDEKFNNEIVKVVADAGVDFLVVHGRHWTEHYETPCLASLKKMFETGCAGVMIGRAGVGQPWLIGQLIADINQEEFIVPDQQAIGLIFIEHVVRLIHLLQSEKFAILQARKLAKYYGRGLADRTVFCEAVNVCEQLAELKTICLRYFC